MTIPSNCHDVKRAEVSSESLLRNGSSPQLSMDLDLKLYKRRWFILSLYVAYMTCNSVQWYQYSIISSVVSEFYGVPAWAVDATSLVIMLSYLLFAIPVAYLMDHTDLRWPAMLGVVGTAVGSWVKVWLVAPGRFAVGFAGQTLVALSQTFVLSVNEDDVTPQDLRWPAMLGVVGTAVGSWVKVWSAAPGRFAVGFAGQTLVALSQTFMLSVPPKLASIWFGENEISTACSVGVFGNQLGLTLGFFLSPLMVRPDPETVAGDLFSMFISIALFTTLVSLVVCAFFQAEPPKPPTFIQAIKRFENAPPDDGYFHTFQRLFSNKHVLFLFLSTGVNNGCFNAMLTLLNQIFVSYFPANEQDAGKIGVTIMISGMVASILFAHVLDATKKYKLLTVSVYLLSAASVMVFAFALESGSMKAVYVASIGMGTFFCSFTAISFDVASELTHPESEVVTATIMNMSSLLFSVAFTIVITIINNAHGYFWGNVTFAAILFVGGMSTIGVKFDLRRLEAQRSGMHTQLSTPDNMSACEKKMFGSV